MEKRERVRITKACRGSENGFSILDFTPDGGENGDGVYDVAPNLAAAFCDQQKTAERVGLAGVADKVKEAVAVAAEAVKEAVAPATPADAPPKKGKAKKGADETPAEG